jgi:molybdate transport system substrate-binding protein
MKKSIDLVWKHGLIALCLLLAGRPLNAAEVSVAVASNFLAPMQRIAAAFEQDTGHKARLAFGSTGKFYAQIKNGAPFQLLLAADEETPRRMEQEGLGVSGSRATYAVGRLVLYSATPGLVDDKGLVLATPFSRLSLADPKLAPYGAAAVQTLIKLGHWQRLQPQLVTGESVGQAFQFVASGNAQLGFVAMSQVMTDGQMRGGSFWLVPQALHAPLKQDMLLLKSAQNNPAALSLVRYLLGDKARSLMRAYGYEF